MEATEPEASYPISHTFELTTVGVGMGMGVSAYTYRQHTPPQTSTRSGSCTLTFHGHEAAAFGRDRTATHRVVNHQRLAFNVHPDSQHGYVLGHRRWEAGTVRLHSERMSC